MGRQMGADDGLGFWADDKGEPGRTGGKLPLGWPATEVSAARDQIELRSTQRLPLRTPADQQWPKNVACTMTDATRSAATL